jgi:zinc protease
MKRRPLILVGIFGLVLVSAQALSARPGETLDQLTRRLGQPYRLTDGQAEWLLRDQTVLYVSFNQAGLEKVSTKECLTHIFHKQPLNLDEVARFLQSEGGPGIEWLPSNAITEVSQPFVYLDDNRASIQYSSDAELTAFSIPPVGMQAILVTPVPNKLKAELKARIAAARAPAMTAPPANSQAASAAIPTAEAVSETKLVSAPETKAVAPPADTAPTPIATPAPPPAAPLPWHWPEVESDLKPDSSVTWSRLPNGLRYAILPNAEPKGRISLRLLVAVGSLHERDDEQGIAHFVEHMVFQGTTSHPGNTLAKELQQLGLGMGPDNTAFTTYDHTIFHLELPNTQDAVLRRCLQALREYAAEATFDPDAVKRERGVVLSEWATRANSGFFVACANTAFLWPHSRRAGRVPIGLAETIRTCTREQLSAFYDAWYRPERLALVVVGNVSPELAENMIKEVFGPLAARGPPRDEPADLIPAQASPPDVIVYSDPSQTGLAYLFENPEPFPRQADTRARRIEALHRGLAFSMFQTRLEKYSTQFPGSFVSPRTVVDYSVLGWQTAVMSAIGRLGDWREMAVALEQEHRRAFARGFTEDELKIARANYANSFDEAVRTAATRPSGWLADTLAACLLYGQVFPTPEELRDDLTAALAATTAAECTAAFRHAWSTKSLHVFLAAHPAFPFEGARIATVLNQSREQATQDLTRPATSAFAYVDFGPPGQLVRDEHVPDLDVHLAEFANGVRLNFKQTAFVADWVEIHLRVGTGQLSQPESRPGLGLFASFALPAGGLGKHSRQDLDDLLAGHSVQVQFNVGTDACVFDGQCAQRDLPTALQLITAYLTDAAFRPEALDDVRAKFSSMYAGLAESAGGPIMLQAPRILAGGDRRFGIPEPDELLSHSMASLARWLEPQFKTGPIEMSVVGDISWEQAREAVAWTLGALPPRERRPVAAGDAGVRCGAPGTAPYIYITPPTIRQVAVAWAWPVSDLKDSHHERRCGFLAAVVADRLNERLREQLGAAYAPTAGFYFYEGFPAYSYFMAYAEVLPVHVARTGQLMREEIKSLRKKPLGSDEFARVKQPFLRARDDQLRTNQYWCLTVLSDAQQRPERLAAARDRAADSAAITPADIQTLANRYLDPNRAFIFMAYPVSFRSN